MNGRPRQAILLIEDEGAVRRALQLMLLDKGFDVRAFGSARAAFASDWIQLAGILLADYRLADGDGIEVLKQLKATGWDGLAILFSGYVTPALREAAQAAGFAAVLEKPVRAHELLPLIE